MYINIDTLEYPITEAQIRTSFPNIAFPIHFQPPSNYKNVVTCAQPSYNELTEEVIELSPELSSSGEYQQKWSVVPLTQEVIDINISNKKSQLLEQVTSLFIIKKYSPVIFNNNTFNGGIESAQLAKSKADMLIYIAQNNNVPLPVNCTFNDINNNPIQLTTNTLQDLAIAIGAQYEIIFQKKAKLKRDIALLQTVEAVSSFNVQEQWDLA